MISAWWVTASFILGYAVGAPWDTVGKAERRILALLNRGGPPMSTNEMNDILGFRTLAPIWIALQRLEKCGVLLSDWRPLEPGRKYRTRIYWLATREVSP
jgi:hypothetical protein